jgi:hypothetical protein
MWAGRLRRNEERGARWEPEKMDLLSELTATGDQLLGLTVWPGERTAAVEPPRPLAVAFDRRTGRYAMRAPAAAAELAYATAAKAFAFADVIEDIRDTTTRGPHGTMDEPSRKRHQQAARDLAEALDRLIVAGRRDLGVKGPHAPRRRDVPR